MKEECQKESGSEVGSPNMVPGVLKVEKRTPVIVGSPVLVSVGRLISKDVRGMGGVDAGGSVGVSCWEFSGIESVKLKGGEVRKSVGSQMSSSLMAGGERWAS